MFFPQGTRFFYKKPGFLGVRPQIWPKVKKPTKKLEASIFRIYTNYAILQYNLSGCLRNYLRNLRPEIPILLRNLRSHPKSGVSYKKNV